MADTLPGLLQEIHSVATPSELDVQFPDFQSRIALILLNDISQENYYVNHTGRELFRKLYNYDLKNLITDSYDSGFRPDSATGIMTFTVALDGDNGTETGGGEIKIGTTINISATPNNLYQFNSWTVSGAGQISDANSANTTFTVGAGDVTITANYSIVNAPTLTAVFADPNIRLTASAVSGTTTYEFQRSTVSDFSANLSTLQNTGSNQHTDSISSPTTFYYRARSISGSTKTAWSNTITGVFTSWTPSAITTKSWYDASDTSTITASSGVVSQVNDKSGNNFHLEVLTAGKTGPKTGTQTLNSLNVLTWDTVGQVLENDAFSHNQESNALYFSVIFKCVIDNSQDFIIAGTESTLAGDRMAIRRITSLDRFQILGGSGGGSNIAITSPANTAPENKDTLVVARFNSANSYIRIDGLLSAWGNIGTNSFSSLNIGANEAELSTINGYIAEIVFFTNSYFQLQIEGYLAHKWGLTNNLPSVHPYKSAPPLKFN
jgi:hypothetical protein